MFEAFGETAWVGRVFDAATKTAIVALTYGLIAGFGRRTLALAGAMVTLGLLMYVKSYEAPLFSALAAGLAAAFATSRLTATASPAAAATAGFTTGIALLIRHDVGIYTAIAESAFIWRLGHAANAAVTAGHIRRIRLAFATALLITVFPAALLLLISVPPTDLYLYENLIDIALFVYPKNRSLPFPPVAEALREAIAQRSMGVLAPLLVYFPIIATTGAVAGEWWRRTTQRSTSEDRSPDPGGLFFQMLILLNALYFLKGLVRVSPLHMSPALVVSVILLSASAARARGLVVRRVLSAVAALALALVILKPLTGGGARNGDFLSDPATIFAGRWLSDADELCSRREVPRLRCLTLKPHQMVVAEYLLAHGSRGARIYVGPSRHDKIFINDIALYFAAESVPATRWHDSHPGVQTTIAVQRAMIAEFGAQPVKFVVLDSEWADYSEPNASAQSSGVTVLDDFLRSQFVPVFESGSLKVLTPKAVVAAQR